MADDAKPTDATTLLTKIAEKAGRNVEDVRSILARHGVAYKPAIAVPKHLCVTSIAFTGEKKGETAPGPVNFAWRELSPGLMAIISDRNFRGKTTLLGLMRWGLTGCRGRGIPTEFAETFHTLTMTFTLDGQAYEVEVVDAVGQVGTLWRIDGGNRLALDAFSSAEGFEAVMSGFFMGQLGLQMLVTHADRGDKGVDQPHDWVWLSGAMVIEPAPENLFGSYQALGSRMLQSRRGATKRCGWLLTSWTATLRPRRRTGSGWPTSPTCPPRPVSSTSRWCSTPSAAGSSAGPWPTICARSWCWTLWRWPLRSASHAT